MLKIDYLAYNNGLLKTNPVLKAGASIILLLLAVLIEQKILQSIIILINFIIVLKFAKIPIHDYIRLYKIPMGFIILGIIAVIMSFRKETIGYLVYFKLFNSYLGITIDGISTATKILLRSFAAISSTYTLALTTPINQQVYVLKKLHLPSSFIEQFILIYRFISLFIKELETLATAITLKQGYSNKLIWIKSASILGTALFQRIMDSYNDYETALELKLFDGEFYY
ncbi:MAG: cobalt ECF transporter T component CbiQ [Tissierellia bacterium]|nr:cobalt ECF transporter T component CbiQ [Tissierellia bacterium]